MQCLLQGKRSVQKELPRTIFFFICGLESKIFKRNNLLEDKSMNIYFTFIRKDCYYFPIKLSSHVCMWNSSTQDKDFINSHSLSQFFKPMKQFENSYIYILWIRNILLNMGISLSQFTQRGSRGRATLGEGYSSAYSSSKNFIACRSYIFNITHF